MTNDLISKSALIEALSKLDAKSWNNRGMTRASQGVRYLNEYSVHNLINTVHVVNSEAVGELRCDATTGQFTVYFGMNEAQQSVTQALEAANIPDARKFIFNGLKACSNHSCIVSGKRKGMGTNGPCHCVTDLTRQQLNMLGSRLDYFLSALIPSTQAKESEG